MASPPHEREPSPAARRPRRPTSRDVAHRAGVSQATVSLVLGGKGRGRVSATTAEAVRTAAGELGYRPNLAARSLRLGRTRTALLVVPALSSDFFARVHAGAAEVAAVHDFGVVLYPSAEVSRPAPDPFGSARAALDGVIASSMAPEALAALHDGALPLVMLDSDPHGTQAATVNLDIAHGMREVAAHLVGLGHRRIGHLAAAVDSWTFRVRAAALAEALSGTTAGLTHIERTPLGVEDALHAATRALTTDGARPTALVCDDDIVAAGASKAARRLGLRVPGDVSVTGFSDLPLATALEPELTTVRLPAEDVGAAGMRALLAVLHDESAETAVLPVQLITRGSTGPVPA